MGYDLTDEDFTRTPERVARYLLSLSQPADRAGKECPEMTTFPAVGNNTPIIVKKLEVRSTCAHHMLPFFGTCSIAYMPTDKQVGLSKMQRIVDFWASGLTSQEFLTDTLAHWIANSIQADGVLIKLECLHTCMVVRGVKNSQATTITFAGTGCFQDWTRHQLLLDQMG